MPTGQAPEATPFASSCLIDLPQFACSYCVGEGLLQVSSAAELEIGDVVPVVDQGRPLSFLCSDCRQVGAPGRTP